MAKRISNIDSVFDTGRKFFGSRKIISDNRLGSIKNARAKVLDSLIFGRVAALGVRIPAILPVLFFDIAGTALELQRAPSDWRRCLRLLQVEA